MLREVVNYRIINASIIIHIEGRLEGSGVNSVKRKVKRNYESCIKYKRYKAAYRKRTGLEGRGTFKPQNIKDIIDTPYSILIMNPKKTDRVNLNTLRKKYFYEDGIYYIEPPKKTIMKIFGKHYLAFKVDEKNPVSIGVDADIPGKKYWYYNNKLYWENDNLDAESVKALADARESKKKRKIEFVKGPPKSGGKLSARYIPDDVKVSVWRRDNARCVKCGSNKNLEFDHIIPVSMGGSSTERNLQLLCERCNREKGADLK